MHNDLHRLYQMAQLPHRLIIGLMSGTSVDGLDVALCKVFGAGAATRVALLAFETVPYPVKFKAAIRSVFAKRDADLEKVCLLNGWVAAQHATIILDCLKKWGIDTATVDLIASHGQTIYHAPYAQHQQPGFSNATLQIGDGDHLAVKTGIITLSDFRQKHIAAGGEGAPLAVYGDYLVFGAKGKNRILLNIGGIANFTWLPGSMQIEEVFSTDTGTGNTLMDAYIQQHFPGQYCDEDAAIASRGVVCLPLLEQLKSDPFFAQPFPKTTGPELFNLVYLRNAQNAAGVGELTHEDIMATLNYFSAITIAAAIKATVKELSGVQLFASGGGMHNPLLMQNIVDALPGCSIGTTADLDINPDAKEAVLFAILANETIAGHSVKQQTTGSILPYIRMGKISFTS